MTITERNLLIDKAKTRKDGVYSYQQYLYVVNDNGLIAFSDYHGNCYSCYGAFNVSIGKVERYNRRKELGKLLKP